MKYVVITFFAQILLLISYSIYQVIRYKSVSDCVIYAYTFTCGFVVFFSSLNTSMILRKLWPFKNNYENT